MAGSSTHPAQSETPVTPAEIRARTQRFMQETAAQAVKRGPAVGDWALLPTIGCALIDLLGEIAAQLAQHNQLQREREARARDFNPHEMLAAIPAIAEVVSTLGREVQRKMDRSGDPLADLHGLSDDRPERLRHAPLEFSAPAGCAVCRYQDNETREWRHAMPCQCVCHGTLPSAGHSAPAAE